MSTIMRDCRRSWSRILIRREKVWGISVVPGQRVQVSPTRFRIPDVCVVLGEPREQIFCTPPFICIEILSSEDRIARMNDRLADYFSFGVAYVFLIDPGARRAWSCTWRNSSTDHLPDLPTGFTPLDP